MPSILYRYIAQEVFTEHVTIEIPDFSVPHHQHIIRVDNQAVTKQKDIDKFLTGYKSRFKESDATFYWEFIKQKKRKPMKNAFQGNVYLLVGGRSISAASYFSALFKSEKRGMIIGEQVGGSHHSITAGTDITYELPYTKIQVTVPLMVVSFADKIYEQVPEKNVIPDKTLATRDAFRYFMAREDAELEEVFKLISGKK